MDGNSKFSSILDRTEDSSSKVSEEIIREARLFPRKFRAADRSGSLGAYAAMSTPVSTYANGLFR